MRPWLVSLRLLACASLLFLGACTLRPAYSPEVAEELARIEVPPLAEREGQIIRLALQRALNPRNQNFSPSYRLDVRYDTQVILPLDEDTDLQTARGILRLDLELLDAAGNRLWAGQESRQGLFARPVLPTLAQQVERDLWADLAALMAQDVAQTLAQVVAN